MLTELANYIEIRDRCSGLLFQFGEEVADGGEGVDEEHTGADVAHHGADIFAVGRRIAVDLAFAAARLGVAFGAVVEAVVGVVQQLPAVVAKSFPVVDMVLGAINLNHLFNHQLFLLYSFHITILLADYYPAKVAKKAVVANKTAYPKVGKTATTRTTTLRPESKVKTFGAQLEDFVKRLRSRACL